MSTFEDYNSSSRNYDKQRFAFAPEIIAAMLQFYCNKPLKELTLLDAGCGTGNYTKAMLEFGVGHICMLDASEGMLTQAKAKLSDEIVSGQIKDVQHSSMPSIPFSDASFDSIMFNMVLHHLDKNPDGKSYPAIEKTLREARRVIKDGGIVAISECLKQYSGKAFWFESIVDAITERYYLQFPDATVWLQMLKRAGFLPLQIMPVKLIVPKSFLDAYNNPEGPLSKEWRDGNSYWAVATPEELIKVQNILKHLKEKGTLEQFVTDNDNSDGFYDMVFLFAKAE